ncbi:hypothetical protein [Lactiplantibacillus plantarum]|uniref:hypothetical protein n=1 Tax=Lactiplantibacillus plantarum TaxID=1590 RepID=UPI000C7ECF78|nr:hypothetical protein [Lactiplantibacillus plantarum]
MSENKDNMHAYEVVPLIGVDGYGYKIYHKCYLGNSRMSQYKVKSASGEIFKIEQRLTLNPGTDSAQISCVNFYDKETGEGFYIDRLLVLPLMDGESLSGDSTYTEDEDNFYNLKYYKEDDKISFKLLESGKEIIDNFEEKLEEQEKLKKQQNHKPSN